MNFSTQIKQLVGYACLSVVIASTSLAQVETDFARAVDPPLLKKIHMYNAGIITPHEANYARDIDKIDALNSNTFRLDIGIGKDGTPGSNPHVVSGDLNNLQYNFSKLDNFVTMSNQHHNRPYMSWCYIPKPLQANNDWLNLNEGIPNWRDKWKEIYKEYASHYRVKAVADPNYRIGYHEIYNEPDLEILKEWGVFPDNFRGFLEVNDFKNYYNDMYKFGALGVREGDPDATVGGPAFALGELGGGFLDYVKGQNLPLDFYSFHSYMDGDTWPKELNTVRDMLTTKGFTNSEIHITEFTWFNDGVGPNDANSPLNFYQAAPRTLDVIDVALNQTDVNIFHWAQFMESTFGDDSYGMIRKDGHLKAVYNVFKIFGDMPIDRRAVNTNNNNLGSFASTDGDRACIVVWNRSGSTQNTSVNFSNVPFDKGNFKLYRIDKQHGSYFDGGTENLDLISSQNNVTAKGYSWSGEIPAHGVVYLVLESPESIGTFMPEQGFKNVGKDIREHYYYFARGKSNYANFDRRYWSAWLGMGNENYAHNQTAVVAENLPNMLPVKVDASGNFQALDANSILALRVDYQVGSGYAKSVLYHGGLYNAGRGSGIDWGTRRQADEVVKKDNFADFTIDLPSKAPANWTGRVIITFIQQNTGAGSRAKFTLGGEKATIVQMPYSGTPIAIPGTIEAEDFDSGANGLSYFDTESTNIGTVYRNEWVDIQQTNDVSGAYNVGWTADGEWLEYTVNVAKAGAYDFQFRVASEPGNGKFTVALDDKEIIAEKTVATTTTWDNWTTIAANNITLPQGEHVLRFNINKGGFNLNYIKIQDSNVTDLSDNLLGTGFSVYPNPNTGNSLKIKVPEANQAYHITMTSLSGQLLEDKVMNANGETIELKHTLPTGSYLISVTGADKVFNELITVY